MVKRRKGDLVKTVEFLYEIKKSVFLLIFTICECGRRLKSMVGY